MIAFPLDLAATPMPALSDERTDRLRLLESAVVHARDAIIVLEGEPRPGKGRSVLYANEAFFQMSGYGPEEVIGRSLHLLRGPKSNPATLDRLREALDTGTPYKGELLNYRKSGESYWVELSLVPAPDATGRPAHWVMVQRDVSDRKRAEEQLLHAQKMELIGQMAGGIAHDFNNLLTGIIGNLSLVGSTNERDGRAIRTALKAAQRAADLTRKLLGFARKSQLVAGPVPVLDILKEVVAIVSPTVAPRVRVAYAVSGDLRISADPTLISQVLLNLCLNAHDAMPQGGDLILNAAGATLTAPTAHPQSRAGEFVVLSVADTGLGMSEDVRAHIFEPFFTTKPVGQGTGLGLAMVHGILTQHGGWVECTSAPGAGTRFDLYLPRLADGVPKPKSGSIVWPTERTVRPTPPAKSGATVLVVDDEDMLRELLRTVLEGAGYRVLEAEDGVEALAVFRKRHARIDLVILDLTMPRSSGQETFRAMRALDPKAKVLLSSGYSHDDLTELDGVLGILPKPYRPAELLGAVEQALAVV